MDKGSLSENDSYLSLMKAARGAPAVLKVRLASLKSALPTTLILAFEGNDDKVVYYHWIKRIKPVLRYEPFPCDGKEQLLQLKDLVDRDLGNLREGLYFFVDRDFDDLRGREPSASIFMTKAYSIENYLVGKGVLEELLKNEFHCHTEIDDRRRVVEIFFQLYRDFLTITADLNRRIFLARRLKIELKAALPTKIGRILNIEVNSVSRGNLSESELVVLEREPTEIERQELDVEFNALDAAFRYRGKFALLFFMKWLEKMAMDRNSDQPRYFPRALNGGKVKFNELTLHNLASKSELPEGLAEFIMRMKCSDNASQHHGVRVDGRSGLTG